MRSIWQENRWAYFFDGLIGSLIYLSTLFFSSNALLIVVLLLLLLRSQTIVWRREYALVVLFVLSAYANIYFHVERFDVSQHFSSLAVPLVLWMALFAPQIHSRSWIVFIFLCCVEVLIGVYEFQAGQVALFQSQVDMARQDMSYDSSYLYDLRVFGLSANSSLLAEKIFLCSLLLVYLADRIKFRSMLWIIILVGLVVSFNRTAIIATFLFFSLLLLSGRLSFSKLLAVCALLGFGFAVLVANFDVVMQQFGRGSASLSYSEMSRFYFWQQAWAHLVDHPFLGNGSLTYRIYAPAVGSHQHAHNSFVMIFATHGLIIPLFLLGFILVRIGKTDWRFMLAILIFSMPQYFIFWNISVPDFVLFWFLGRNIYESGWRGCSENAPGDRVGFNQVAEISVGSGSLLAGSR